jgi:hypothetical protein
MIPMNVIRSPHKPRDALALQCHALVFAGTICQGGGELSRSIENVRTHSTCKSLSFGSPSADSGT